MSSVTENNEFHAWWESFDEMKRELPAMIAVANEQHFKSSVTYSGQGRDWYHANSSRMAMEKCESGWPELVAELQPMIEKLREALALGSAAVQELQVRKRKIRRMDHGDSLDITRVWNGDLEHAWSKPCKFPRLARSQKYVTIFADLACGSIYTAQDTLWRAASAYVLIDVLTRMGVSTEVWSGCTGSPAFASSYAPKSMRAGVRIKNFDQPLNADRLAVMMCAPFYRTWGFGMYMAGPWAARSGLAMVQDHVKALPKPLQLRREAGERVVLVAKALSFSKALTVVQETIDSIKEDVKAA